MCSLFNSCFNITTLLYLLSQRRESDKLPLKKICCQNGAKALDSGAERSSSECMPRHPSAAGSRQQTFGKGHHRRQVMDFSI